ncbi:uncharacterized protein LOC118611348 [Rousettus aegyptiacus]|uniref:uncharacterized protein LOC118611348 n=1 Tax=Rousettus aegyptiacus TaxID=9407 RepID=UPI00168D435D|nr:uncharacterized protein LOC118611348 [Rousettus aegyptiacus]
MPVELRSPHLQHPGRDALRTQRGARTGPRAPRYVIRQAGVCQRGIRPLFASTKKTALSPGQRAPTPGLLGTRPGDRRTRRRTRPSRALETTKDGVGVSLFSAGRLNPELGNSKSRAQCEKENKDPDAQDATLTGPNLDVKTTGTDSGIKVQHPKWRLPRPQHSKRGRRDPQGRASHALLPMDWLRARRSRDSHREGPGPRAPSNLWSPCGRDYFPRRMHA